MIPHSAHDVGHRGLTSNGQSQLRGISIQRHATAVWQGDLQDGNGIISTECHELANARYSFSGRFNHGTGTNPVELLAAAQAGCYSMALSLMPNESGVIVERIDTKVCISIVPERHGFSINAVHLATLVNAL